MDDFATFIKECYEADTHSTDPLLFVRLSGIEVVHYGMSAAFFDPAAWLAFADEYLPTPPNGHTVH